MSATELYMKGGGNEIARTGPNLSYVISLRHLDCRLPLPSSCCHPFLQQPPVQPPVQPPAQPPVQPPAQPQQEIEAGQQPCHQQDRVHKNRIRTLKKMSDGTL